MGLIYAISGNVVGIIDDIWGDYVSMNNLPDGNLENGTRIFLAENQVLLLLSREKIVDCAVAAGGYVYDSEAKAYMSSGIMAERIAEIRAEFSDAFSDDVSESISVQILSFEQSGMNSFVFNDDLVNKLLNVMSTEGKKQKIIKTKVARAEEKRGPQSIQPECFVCGLQVRYTGNDWNYCPRCGLAIKHGVTSRGGNEILPDDGSCVRDEDKIYKICKAKLGAMQGGLLMKRGLLIFKGQKKEIVCKLEKVKGLRTTRADEFYFQYPTLLGGYTFTCDNANEWIIAITHAQNGIYPTPVNLPTNSVEKYIYMMKDELSKNALVNYHHIKTGADRLVSYNVVNRILGDVFFGWK